jgi:hypothetical protein
VLGVMRAINAMEQDNYPETLGALYLVNVARAFSVVWSVVAPWLSRHTISKARVEAAFLSQTARTDSPPPRRVAKVSPRGAARDLASGARRLSTTTHTFIHRRRRNTLPRRQVAVLSGADYREQLARLVGERDSSLPRALGGRGVPGAAASGVDAPYADYALRAGDDAPDDDAAPRAPDDGAGVAIVATAADEDHGGAPRAASARAAAAGPKTAVVWPDAPTLTAREMGALADALAISAAVRSRPPRTPPPSALRKLRDTRDDEVRRRGASGRDDASTYRPASALYA